MPNNPLGLNRDQLAKALGGNYSVIRAFEQLQIDAALAPSTIEEAASIANTAMSAATQALDMLREVLDALEPIASAPIPQTLEHEESFTPPVVFPNLGTIAEQDADNVAISGGAIDGTPIGEDQPAPGAFTILEASGAFGVNGKAPQGPASIGAAATDLPTAIVLLNKIRLALIANGIAS